MYLLKARIAVIHLYKLHSEFLDSLTLNITIFLLAHYTVKIACYYDIIIMLKYLNVKLSYHCILNIYNSLLLPITYGNVSSLIFNNSI